LTGTKSVGWYVIYNRGFGWHSPTGDVKKLNNNFKADYNNWFSFYFINGQNINVLLN